jgi:aspartyl-tRNA(Asn)/glutamyl-tRNA(Gln) amidotransferase subunit A
METYMRSRAQGLGPEVKRRIMLGTYALSVGYYDAYYLKAQKVRALIHRDFVAAFKHCDAIITPTSPTTAFKISEKIQNPVEMYLSDIYTTSINLAGVPAISVPCGLDAEGLPIGMQVIGKPFDEATILSIAYTYEQHTEWHRKKPALSSI